MDDGKNVYVVLKTAVSDPLDFDLDSRALVADHWYGSYRFHLLYFIQFRRLTNDRHMFFQRTIDGMARNRWPQAYLDCDHAPIPAQRTSLAVQAGRLNQQPGAIPSLSEGGPEHVDIPL